MPIDKDKIAALDQQLAGYIVHELLNDADVVKALAGKMDAAGLQKAVAEKIEGLKKLSDENHEALLKAYAKELGKVLAAIPKSVTLAAEDPQIAAILTAIGTPVPPGEASSIRQQIAALQTSLTGDGAVLGHLQAALLKPDKGLVSRVAALETQISGDTGALQQLKNALLKSDGKLVDIVAHQPWSADDVASAQALAAVREVVGQIDENLRNLTDGLRKGEIRTPLSGAKRGWWHRLRDWNGRSDESNAAAAADEPSAPNVPNNPAADDAKAVSEKRQSTNPKDSLPAEKTGNIKGASNTPHEPGGNGATRRWRLWLAFAGTLAIGVGMGLGLYALFGSGQPADNPPAASPAQTPPSALAALQAYAKDVETEGAPDILKKLCPSAMGTCKALQSPDELANALMKPSENKKLTEPERLALLQLLLSKAGPAGAGTKPLFDGTDCGKEPSADYPTSDKRRTAQINRLLVCLAALPVGPAKVEIGALAKALNTLDPPTPAAAAAPNSNADNPSADAKS